MGNGVASTSKRSPPQMSTQASTITSNPTPMATGSPQRTNNVQPKSTAATSSYGWYWQENDDSWNLYDGSTGSITSDNIERSYQNNHQSSFSFTLNGASYVIDFASGIQTNQTTGYQRNVERRLVQYDWFWQEDNGQWKQYDSTVSGVSSAQITASFHQNNAADLRFNTTGCSYVIDFKNMVQKNETTGRTRSVKRELTKSPTFAAQQLNVQPSSNDWYWLENDNTWHPFDTATSDFIETKFAANPNDNFTFQLGAQSYQIDLWTMTQTNRKTGKKRPIVRTPNGVTPTPVVAKRPAVNVQVQPSSSDWLWLENDNTWHPFDRTSSDFIEAKFAAIPNDNFTLQLGAQSYQIDLQTMTQSNQQTGKKRPIVRTPKGVAPPSAAAFPQTWDLNARTNEHGVALVDVTPFGPTANEFNEVCTLFNKSMLGLRLKSVKRIQNKQLWEQFNVAKQQLEKRLGPGKGVRYLFHGTTKNHIDGLCTQGFDPRLSGMSTGTKFGKGSYFARDASYSKQYTDSNTLIIAQVLVGKSAIGNPAMVRPPPTDWSQPNGQLFDSCVNDLRNPEIFVVFERAHSYPEYMIQY